MDMELTDAYNFFSRPIIAENVGISNYVLSIVSENYFNYAYSSM